MVWKCQMASFVFFTHRRRPFGCLMLNKYIRRNKMNEVRIREINRSTAKK